MAKTINPAILKLLIVIIFVAFAWALLSKACHSNPQPIIVKQDSINATSKRVIAKLEKENKDFKQQLDITNDFIKDVMADREAKESDLNKATAKIRAWSKVVHGGEMFDITSYLNKGYDSVQQRECDSLAQLAYRYANTVTAFQYDADSLQILLFQSSHLKDSLVLRLEMMRSQCSAVVNDLNKLVSKSLVVHRKVYVEVAAGTIAQYGGYIQAGGTYFDRKGNGFGIRGGPVTTGQWMAEGKYARLLTLHK